MLAIAMKVALSRSFILFVTCFLVLDQNSFRQGKLVYRGCAEPAVIIRPWDPCLLMGRTFTSRGKNTGWNTASSLVLVHGDRKPILEITHTQPQQERHLKNKSQRLCAHTMSLACLTGAITACTPTIIKVSRDGDVMVSREKRR